jgi:hypothetical protein
MPTCKSCGIIFPLKKGAKGKYCTASCAHEGMRKKPRELKKCLNCGKEFMQSRGSKGYYCTVPCAAAHNKGRIKAAAKAPVKESPEPPPAPKKEVGAWGDLGLGPRRTPSAIPAAGTWEKANLRPKWCK